jgi:hypothetical protein
VSEEHHTGLCSVPKEWRYKIDLEIIQSNIKFLSAFVCGYVTIVMPIQDLACSNYVYNCSLEFMGHSSGH